MPRTTGPVAPTDIEKRLSRSGAIAAALLAPITVGIAALVAGVDGAVGAAVAAVIIVGVVLMMGPPLSWAARKGPEALMGVALGGFAVRLGIYVGLLALLRDLEAIHGPSLAVSGAVLMVAALVAEMRAAVRTPGFYWVFAGSPGQKGSTQ